MFTKEGVPITNRNKSKKFKKIIAKIFNKMI